VLEQIFARFGELQPSTNGVAVRLDGKGDLAGVVRALDSAEVAVADLHLHAPTLDDVFLAKTGRSLEGSEEPSEPEA
jgi:ABC-2 type transport system ATP-binding protein